MQAEFNAGRQQCLRYRGSSGIASATADLLASPIGDENRQRPLPRMPDTRVPSTRLPLPRIQETPLITADLLVVLPVLLSLTSTPASIRAISVYGNEALRRAFEP